jgi:hypothetical protein
VEGSLEGSRGDRLVVHDNSRTGHQRYTTIRDATHFVRPYGGADYAALRAFELYAERWGRAQIPPVAFEPGDALIDELLWQALIIYF